MAILNKFLDLLKINGSNIKAHHVAITTDGVLKWAKEHKKGLDEAFDQHNLIIKSSIKTQIKLNIPILTIFLLPSNVNHREHFDIKIDSFVELFNDLMGSDFVLNNRVKFSVFGKWYDLPGRVVEPIKKLLDTTKDYDSFFVNFCINYNGQEEIVDSCKILAMQIKSQKIGIEQVKVEHMKENIYSSDFLPPDLIIKNGKKQKLKGFLLWDSSNASIVFTKKLFPDFGKSDFEGAVYEYEKGNV